MPEIATTTPPVEDVEATEGSPEPLPQSVEELNAIWAKRVSGKDKAHAAEVAELRRQMESLKAPASASPNETPEQARIRELEARLAETEKQRQIDIRRARFPLAAEYLGEALAAADEAKLAGLEALLADEKSAPAAPRVPNSAPRKPAANTTEPKEPTKQDLLDQLKALSGPYADYLKERYG